MISATEASPVSHQTQEPKQRAAGVRCELINSKELAVRWRVPESWIREAVRRRTTDRIPHVRFGKYVRFEYGCPELDAWLARHRCCKDRGDGSDSRLS
jgi:hypothetical protein